MRLKTALSIGSAIVLTGLLAACGGSDTSAPPTPVGPTSLESKFGSEFATIFDASSTSQPTPLDSGSVPPLAPADQPVTFPS